jgi:hypothetical protein
MCFAVYIGTNKKLELGTFVADQTDIYFEKLSEEEEIALRSKFSKTNIYYVGSDTNCSCGLSFDSVYFDNPEEQINKKSPTRFIEFLKEMTLTEDIEYYCCWEGDWNLPIENTQVIDIREISLNKNYFGLTEKEFINFKRQTTE